MALAARAAFQPKRLIARGSSWLSVKTQVERTGRILGLFVLPPGALKFRGRCAILQDLV